MKYKSITSPNIEHDVANLLTEFLYLNKDITISNFPWRGEEGKRWGKTVAIFKKLMKHPYELDCEQMAFYIWKCKPHEIDQREFAKIAVVAKKLFQKYSLEEVSRLYSDKRKSLKDSGLSEMGYKTSKPRSLLTFLKELENGEIED